jgi:hypothetical protein
LKLVRKFGGRNQFKMKKYPNEFIEVALRKYPKKKKVKDIKASICADSHKYMRNKIDTSKCEWCGITDEEYLKKNNKHLSLHCNEKNKKYLDFNENLWYCVCDKCHLWTENNIK